MTPSNAHTLASWLDTQAMRAGERIAIDDRGVLIGYRELNDRATALADRLTAAGYGAGGRIATLTGNSADHVVVFFACAKLGIALVPLSWRLTATELAALLERTEADLLLIEDEYATLGSEALRALGDTAPTSTELGVAGVEREVPMSRTPRERREPVDDDPLLIIFTSGSEAAPKGVVLTHANCFWTNYALSRELPLTAHDTVLAMLPQHHVAAWNVQPLAAWSVGARVVLERSFQPGRVLQLIRERGVTAMMGVPTQYRMLFAHPEATAPDFASLRTVAVGGSTISRQLALHAAELGIPLSQGYGLTEAGPNVLCLRADELDRHPGAVGRPYPSVETRIVDPDTGLTLEGPATGELWVRGPSVFAGYLGDPEASKRAFSDGWLRSGDLVERDAAGIHRVVDRLKNIYVSGGENVAPAEVEVALASHPLVEAAAVVGVPDETWGERGFAFVVTNGPVSVDELLAHARGRLAGFKVPRHIVVLDELPRSTIDKVARRELERIARAHLAATEGSEPHVSAD